MKVQVYISMISGLATRSNSNCYLCQPPDPKPIRRQPLNDYSLRLRCHIFLQAMANPEGKTKHRQKRRSTRRPNGSIKCQPCFGENCELQFRKLLEILYTCVVFYDTRKLGNYRQIIWSTSIQYSGQFPTDNLGESGSLCVNLNV